MPFLELTCLSIGAAAGQVMLELQRFGVRSIGVTPLSAASVQSQLIGAIAFEYGFAMFIRKSVFWYVRLEMPISSYGRRDLDSRCRGRISQIPAKDGPYAGEIIAFNVHDNDDLITLIRFLHDSFGAERKERPHFSELSRCGGLPSRQYEPFSS